MPDRQRARTILCALLWVAGSAYVVVKLGWRDVSYFRDGMVAPGIPLGRDFVNLWSGGQMALSGELEHLYSLEAYAAFQAELFGKLRLFAYSYPPSTLAIAVPFALLPYTSAWIAWLIITGGLFLWAARSYVRQVPGFPLAAAVLTPAATINIWAGHYGFLTGALWLAAFAAIDKHPRRAGLFAGLLTIKPHLGILIPPLLLLRRRWTTVAVAALVALAMVLVSGIAFGFPLWRTYLLEVSRFQASLLDHWVGIFLVMMPTSFAALRIVDAAEWVRWAGQAATALIAIALWLRAAKAGTHWRDMAFISATATFLILPYAFNYDMTVASLGFGLCLFGQWRRLNVFERIILALAFVTPQLVMPLGRWDVPATPLILVAALWVQVRLAVARGDGERLD